MKPNTRTRDFNSTLQGEKVSMGIQAGAMAHIMSILTDLYSDPELAVLREYSTNALDSHIEAGISRPIEVTTPSPLSPYFRVRDYGVGLDAEGIREIYSQYGASTKRSSNDVVGMLGLGCKSALTYTDQFTLTGVKDGIATQVSISRDEDGSGSMTIVNEYETADPNGVEIVIPSKLNNDFEKKADDFFRFWKPGTVLVNGKQPDPVDGLWITDDLLLTQETDNSYIVMGNVAYPCPEINPGGGSSGRYNYQTNSYYPKYAVIAWVNIGDVDFTPSREALQHTKHTTETIANLKTRIAAERDKALLKMIDDAPNHRAALDVASEVRGMGLSVKAVYKGEEVPTQFHPDKDVQGNFKYFIFLQPVRVAYGRRKQWSKTGQVNANEVDGFIWFTDYESDEFTSYKRDKLDQWMVNNNVARPTGGFIFCDTLSAYNRLWIDPKNIHSWDGPNAEKVVRAKTTTNSGRPTGSYEGWVDKVSNNAIVAGDIDTNNPVLWVAATDVDRWSDPEGLDLIYDNHQKFTLVKLGANRVEKFKRDFPMATTLREECARLADAWKSKITDEQKIAMALKGSDERRFVLALRKYKDEILDPELHTLFTCLDLNVNTLIQERRTYTKWTTLPKIDSVLDAYPLLTVMSTYATLGADMESHLVLYVNAAYAANKEVASV